MTTTHKLIATIPCGDPDLGAEIETEITFTYLKGAPEQGPSYYSGGQPADPDEIEFVSVLRLVDTKPAPFNGAFADLEQDRLEMLALNWLETDEGQELACLAVEDDDNDARERAAEDRAEMRREDRERDR